MNIRFSGTHAFQTDRLLKGPDFQRLANALLKGTGGSAMSMSTTFTSSIGEIASSQTAHLVIAQGNNEAEDRLILANAETEGIAPHSIESIDLNFLPITPGSLKEKLFSSWMALSGLLGNRTNVIE